MVYVKYVYFTARKLESTKRRFKRQEIRKRGRQLYERLTDDKAGATAGARVVARVFALGGVQLQSSAEVVVSFIQVLVKQKRSRL